MGQSFEDILMALFAFFSIGAMVLIIILLIISIFTMPPATVCNKSKPVASDIVYCMATMTAEARHK